MLILKVNIYRSSVVIFFYSLVSKIEICLKYFLDKNPPKQPLWDRTGVIKGRKFFYVIDALLMTIVIFQ